ncbi:type II toxin-antitoxin system RelB/DinJ family antitoxin [Candidatus Peregrinibacteria bacterium]|nr:type II toxin-antitoxin system RelB/DinJ family antitoxin [Candidatus Peregrinibacteria bacterium]
MDKNIKEEAQKLAQELGLSLSAVIKMLLKEFVRTKELHVRIKKIPPHLEKKWEKDIQEARKNGKRYSDTEELLSDLKK